VERLKALQREIHESFIALVKERRGAKLDSRETALFSGAYWTGQRGLELGLVDAVGDLRNVLRGRYGEKLRTPLIAERGFFGRRVAGVSHGGGFKVSDNNLAVVLRMNARSPAVNLPARPPAGGVSRSRSAPLRGRSCWRGD